MAGEGTDNQYKGRRAKDYDWGGPLLAGPFSLLVMRTVWVGAACTCWPGDRLPCRGRGGSCLLPTSLSCPGVLSTTAPCEPTRHWGGDRAYASRTRAALRASPHARWYD